VQDNVIYMTDLNVSSKVRDNYSVEKTFRSLWKMLILLFVHNV